MLKYDLYRVYASLKGGKLKKLAGCLREPGVYAVINLRFGQWLKKQNVLCRLFLEPFYLLPHQIIRFFFGIEISRGAKIGKGLHICHYGGIIISSEAVIGKNATILQQVTIGIAGKGDKRGAPIIGDNCHISPGAKIIGKLRIGDNVKVGPNAVIYKDIPDGAVAVLSPGFKVVSYSGNMPSNVLE